MKANKATNQFIAYLNELFAEMREWDQTYLHDITGSHHYPCWSSDPTQASESEQNYITHMGYDITNLSSFPTLQRPKKHPYKTNTAQITWAQVTAQAPSLQNSTVTNQQSYNIVSSSPNQYTVNKQGNIQSDTAPTPTPTSTPTTSTSFIHEQQFQTLKDKICQLEQSQLSLKASIKQQQDANIRIMRDEIHTTIQSNNTIIIDQLQQLHSTSTTSMNEQINTRFAQATIAQEATTSKTNQLLQSISTAMIQLNSLAFLKPIELTLSQLQDQLTTEITKQSTIIHTCLEQQQQIITQQSNLERRYNGMYDCLTNVDIPAELPYDLPPPTSHHESQIVAYVSPTQQSTTKNNKTPQHTADVHMESLISGQKRTSDTLRPSIPAHSTKLIALPSDKHAPREERK